MCDNIINVFNSNSEKFKQVHLYLFIILSAITDPEYAMFYE